MRREEYGPLSLLEVGAVFVVGLVIGCLLAPRVGLLVMALSHR